MGAFLPTPKTEKESGEGEKSGLKYAWAAMQGWRVDMEDAHTIDVTDKLGKDTCLFAVFDGHAGPNVAKRASQNLLTHLDNVKGEMSFDEKMKIAFEKLDEELKKMNDRSGSTALVCTITPTHVIFSNCGDSRGFLCRYTGNEDKGEQKICFATEDHKPYNEEEQARIEKAGGTVMMQRVNGSLAVSRALGDFDYKHATERGPFEQMVSPEPETTTIKRSEDDKFVLLACDGIYDVMSNEEIADFIISRLKIGLELKEVCSELIDLCLHKNSRDNMTVILVTFPGAPTLDEETKVEMEKTVQTMKDVIDKGVTDIADKASDPMDLDFLGVWTDLDTKVKSEFKLNSSPPEFFLMKDYAIKVVDEKRKDKFGLDRENSFSREDSDPLGDPGQKFESMSSGYGEDVMDTTEPAHQQFGDSSHSSSDPPPASGSSKDPDDSNKPMDS